MDDQRTDREGGQRTYSVALRMRRVTYEDDYIAVPVTVTVMKEEADGSARLDTDALIAEAIRISENRQVEWRVESASAEPHPIQLPMPDGRTSYDPWRDGVNSASLPKEKY